MAEDSSWPSIRQYGLRSTSSLLDLYGYKREQRVRIEAEHRPESVVIRRSGLSDAVIRDQKPMSDSALRRCLAGMTPAAWYKHLNARVFFWATEKGLRTLLDAAEYRSRPHVVLACDTATLIERYGPRITLSAMNSGCTRPFAWPRGAKTFKRINEYPLAERLRRYGTARGVIEVAVDEAVPDVSGIVLRVDRRQGDKLLGNLPI
jgi:hypothetical protein